MEYRNIINNSIKDHLAAVASLSEMADEIYSVAVVLKRCLDNGGKIVLIGNGGSAADSQHIAAELVGRFNRERVALAAIALTTDSSIITSIGNDFGFDQIFSRQVQALCTHKDVLIGISTSGNSINVIKAIDTAKSIGIFCVGLLAGSGGRSDCHSGV